jgi:hypothetical protein
VILIKCTAMDPVAPAAAVTCNMEQCEGLDRLQQNLADFREKHFQNLYQEINMWFE